MNVKGKVVMITGAGGGLGSEMARVLCENHAKVFILDVDAEKGRATADAICKAGHEAWFVKADVTCEADWQAAVDKVVDTCGRLDVLVRLSENGLSTQRGPEQVPGQRNQMGNAFQRLRPAA